VVSDKEGDMVSLVELDNLNGLFSKGSSIAMRPTLLSTKISIPAKLTVLSPQTANEDERMCCIFPGSALELKKEIDVIFREETAKLFETYIKKAFKNTKMCAVVKTKKASKPLS